MNESEKKDKYVDLARELKKKTMEHEGDGDTSCKWCARSSHQSIVKKDRNGWTSGDHPKYCFSKTGQDTEKNPGDMNGFAVT